MLANRRGKKYTVKMNMRIMQDFYGLMSHPKNATAHDHPTAPIQLRVKGGDPSFSISNRPKAGRMPTNPAARGI